MSERHITVIQRRINIKGIRIAAFSGFVHRPAFHELKDTMFQKLHSFPFSGKREKHLHCWVPVILSVIHHPQDTSDPSALTLLGPGNSELYNILRTFQILQDPSALTLLGPGNSELYTILKTLQILHDPSALTLLGPGTFELYTILKTLQILQDPSALTLLGPGNSELYTILRALQILQTLVEVRP
jgi:hypothetical protein